ncbi:MAG: hypothetical protein IAF38_10725, partial [Bacteroidia bacterium]|nr:hypothetical protein [Bacteroidia bacterium]
FSYAMIIAKENVLFYENRISHSELNSSNYAKNVFLAPVFGMELRYRPSKKLVLSLGAHYLYTSLYYNTYKGINNNAIILKCGFLITKKKT